MRLGESSSFHFLLLQFADMLVDQNRETGSYQVAFDASALSSGIYLYRMEAAGQILTRRMTLVK